MTDTHNPLSTLRHCKTKISTSQQRAILALLVEPSVAAAAVKANVGERTLHRWMRLEHFSQEYRFARREAFCQAIALTQRSSAAAVAILLRVMHDPSTTAAARVTAATNILKFARESIELDDLAARIDMLEAVTRKDEP